MIVLFLVSSSLVYCYQSQQFLRNGMLNLKRSAEAIVADGMDVDAVYVANKWINPKLGYFLKYTKRILNYDCALINCSDDRYDSGSFIKNSYVLISVDPYTAAGFVKLPAFVADVPKSWRLVASVQLPQRGVFLKTRPRVYYVS